MQTPPLPRGGRPRIGIPVRLSMSTDPDPRVAEANALFCAGDLIALGALDALRVDLGVRVPEEVAVVGFDDVAAASWGSFELSTVRQPVDRLVQETLAVVTGAADVPPRRVTVPVTFVPRSTTRPGVPAAQALLTETVL